MSTMTTAKKRKSADSTTATSKKAKIAKSADKPAPLKSALKAPKTATTSKSPTQNGTTTTKKHSKRKTSKPIVSDPEPKEIEEASEEPALTPTQTAALLAGFSSDSSSANSDDENEPSLPLSSLPKASTATTTTLQKTATSASAEDPETTPSVLYLGRIPHGFHETQMRAYFSQFGTLTNLRLARNKKTGKSQHYAFLEFASSTVAEIVRKTMDKYLLAGHLLQVRHVPRELVRENLFEGAGRKGWRRAPRNRFEGRRLERGMGRGEWEGRVERERVRRGERQGKLEALGYDFPMPSVKGVEDVAVKVKEVEVLTSGDVGRKEVTVAEEKVTEKRPVDGKTEGKKVRT